MFISHLFPDRLKAGRLTLTQLIVVRIHVGERDAQNSGSSPQGKRIITYVKAWK